MTEKTKFYGRYTTLPPKVVTKLDTETQHVSQAEGKTAGLQYQISRYGMDGLQARMDLMRSKFGYADCTKMKDFREMQNRVVEGTKYFEALPSEIREKFGHKAENFFEYIEKNKEKAVKEGYIDKKEIAKTIDVAKDQILKNEDITENKTVIEE